MAKVKITDLFESLFKPELKLTYKNSEITSLEIKQSTLNKMLSEIKEDEFESKEDYKEYLNILKNDLKETNKNLSLLDKTVKIKSVDLLITKLTSKEQQICSDKVSEYTTKLIENSRKEDRVEEITKLKVMLDPQGIFSQDIAESTDEGQEVFENMTLIKDMLVNQILLAEGKSDEWANNIDDNDLDLELSEAQEKLLQIDERAEPELQAEAMLELSENRDELREMRRASIIEERQKKLKERRDKLQSRGFDALLEILYNYKILSVSHQKGAEYLDDLRIFYSVKDPNSPIEKVMGGDKVISGYERFFDSVEEIEHIRNNYENFYNWLITNYNELQLIRTREDLERLARSNLFLTTL